MGRGKRRLCKRILGLFEERGEREKILNQEEKEAKSSLPPSGGDLSISGVPRQKKRRKERFPCMF